MPSVVQPPAVQTPLRVSLMAHALPLLKKTWAFLKISPIGALLIYTALSLCLKENFPFSNYPMYSNPSSERPYYTIADGAGQPIPVQKLTGITCPKIGKIFRKKADELSKKQKVKAKDLPQESIQKISDEMFAQLRHEAKGKNQVLPEQLQLIKSYISYRDHKVVEDVELIAKETLHSAAR